MKSKILFTFLLVAIAIIGFNGTDIANRIFGISDAEQTAVSKNSIKTDAVYISSYDEISFDPMKIIDYPSRKSTFINQSEDIVFGFSSSSPFTMSDMIEILIRNISLYSDKTAYAEPADMDISKMIYVDSNGYFFIEKHKYYNTKHEERYVDMIFDSNSFDIIYLNFYDDKEYNPTSAQVQKGISRLQEYSNAYFDSINEYRDIDNWIFHSYNVQHGYDEEPVFHFNATLYESKEILAAYISSVCGNANTASKVSGGSNPVIKFFMNVTAPALVTFEDDIAYGEKYNGNINYDEPFIATIQVLNPYNIFYDVIDSGASSYANGEYDIKYGSSSPYDDAEYAPYNGRIYQTIKTNYSEKYVIIYNIVTNEIEGFYIKPVEKLW
ncbi:MAG: hypothetical protein IJY19_03620 [Ruminococcus sp.]|nr:hypothetical protein [Ruminococcus sp.]